MMNCQTNANIFKIIVFCLFIALSSAYGIQKVEAMKVDTSCIADFLRISVNGLVISGGGTGDSSAGCGRSGPYFNAKCDDTVKVEIVHNPSQDDKTTGPDPYDPHPYTGADYVSIGNPSTGQSKIICAWCNPYYDYTVYYPTTPPPGCRDFPYTTCNFPSNEHTILETTPRALDLCAKCPSGTSECPACFTGCDGQPKGDCGGGGDGGTPKCCYPCGCPPGSGPGCVPGQCEVGRCSGDKTCSSASEGAPGIPCTAENAATVCCIPAMVRSDSLCVDGVITTTYNDGCGITSTETTPCCTPSDWVCPDCVGGVTTITCTDGCGGTRIQPCPNPNLKCGTAAGGPDNDTKTYPFGSTSYGTDTFCYSGIPYYNEMPVTPNNTIPFPPPTITWQCKGSEGTTSVDCHATLNVSTSSCGSASKDYPQGTTSYGPNPEFCTTGTPSYDGSPVPPADILFPDPSRPTITWQCATGGETPVDCPATLTFTAECGSAMQTYPAGSTFWDLGRSNQYIWVANKSSNNVTQLDPDGNVIKTFDTGASPTGVAVDMNGNSWVTNYGVGGGADSVSKFNSAGGISATYPAGDYPVGIAIDASDNIWVTNPQAHTVTKFNSTGDISATYPAGNYPYGIAIDSLGNAWVTDETGGNVLKISSLGILLATYPAGDNPYGIAIDASDNVWVTNPPATVKKLNSSGDILGTFLNFTVPVGIAVDFYGNVWVTNVYGGSENPNGPPNGMVSKLNSSGGLIGNYDVPIGASGIAVDFSGNVWVVNSSGGSVTKLNGSTGAIIKTSDVGTSSYSLGDFTGFANQWFVNRQDVTLFCNAGIPSPIIPEFPTCDNLTTTWQCVGGPTVIPVTCTATHEECTIPPESTCDLGGAGGVCNICGGGAPCKFDTDCATLPTKCVALPDTCTGGVPEFVCAPGGTGPDCTTDADCQNITAECNPAAEVPTAVAPTEDLCNVGLAIPNPVNGTGPWNWDCVVGPGNSVPCSAPIIDTPPPEITGLSLNQVYCSAPGNGGTGTVALSWVFSPNNTQTRFEVQISENNSFNPKITINRDTDTTGLSLTIIARDVPGSEYLEFNKTYYWKVTACNGLTEDDCSTVVYYNPADPDGNGSASTFKTADHPYPNPAIYFTPANPIVYKTVNFQDVPFVNNNDPRSTCYKGESDEFASYDCNQMTPEECLKSIGGHCYSWWFDYGNKKSADSNDIGRAQKNGYPLAQKYISRLQICDDIACCAYQTPVDLTPPSIVPNWIEITPF